MGEMRLDIERELLARMAAGCLAKMVGEGLILSKIIRAEWGKRIAGFSEAMDLWINFEGARDPTYPKKMLTYYREQCTSNFIDSVMHRFDEYINHSYKDGIQHVVYGKAKRKADVDILVQQLTEMTGSQAKSIRNTLGRWFSQTQGAYFDRFIVPETERLQRQLQEGTLDKARMRTIGERYKKFVQADGYWDAISDFDTATASVWGMLDTMKELGYLTYTIVAMRDSKTCEVCIAIDGTEVSVEEGQLQKNSMITLGAEDAANSFPWPRIRPDETLDGSSFLPPFHSRCRCYLVGTRQGPTKVSGVDIQNFRSQYSIPKRWSDSLIREYISVCLNLKELRRECLSRQAVNMTNMQMGLKGESIMKSILGIPDTPHKYPVDLVADKGVFGNLKKIGLEVKTWRADKVHEETKVKMGPRAMELKDLWSADNMADVFTFFLVHDAEGKTDIYYRPGYGGYRIGAMKFVGQVTEDQNGQLKIPEDVRENIISAIVKGKPMYEPIMTEFQTPKRGNLPVRGLSRG